MTDAASPSDAPSLTERLAAHCARPVDAAARARARLHLLDWLGCVAGGLRDGARFTGPHRTPWESAALLGNLMEMDDVHRSAILHPGPVVWAAALQEAALAGTRVDAMLDAAVRGYEAMIGVGATFDTHHYARYHNTATAGVFGSAAVSWSLDGGTLSTLAMAFGLAGSVAGGLWRMRHEAGDTKQFHILQAVATGRLAAYEAESGLRGPRFILEGEQGLWDATCAEPRRERLLGAPERWRIHDVSFKPWAACRHAHPAIDAALEVLGRHGFDGPVHVETYRDALAFCDRPHPTTTQEAKFSLQHAVAVVMVRGEPRLADFEAEAIADPALAAARARVTVAEHAAFTARYPDHFGARVRCGEVVAELIDTRGDSERPLDSAGIEAKARTLMDWGGVGDDADQVVEFALHTADDAWLPYQDWLERWTNPPNPPGTVH